jgi:hypothetical protein
MLGDKTMKTIDFIAAAATLAAGPVLAQPVTPAPEKDAGGVYQVFRTTDNQLSCEQLTREMNTLNQQIKKQAEADAKKAKGGRAGRSVAGGAVTGLLGGAARYGIARNIPGLGYAGAQAAAAASDAAAKGVGDAVANGGQQDAAPAAVSDQKQRMNRVAQLFAAKNC